MSTISSQSERNIAIVKTSVIAILANRKPDKRHPLGHGRIEYLTAMIISAFEEVRGAYDLFIYNFGPNKNYASMHIEVPDTMTLDHIMVLIRKIEKKVYHKTGVILTGIGAYSYNTKDDEAASIRRCIRIIFT